LSGFIVFFSVGELLIFATQVLLWITCWITFFISWSVHLLFYLYESCILLVLYWILCWDWCILFTSWMSLRTNHLPLAWIDYIKLQIVQKSLCSLFWRSCLKLSIALIWTWLLLSTKNLITGYFCCLLWGWDCI
jgi:hypothetical protein